MNFISRTTDGAMVAASCKVRGYYITGDGTNNARAIFYDDPDSADGTVLMELRCGANESQSVIFGAGQFQQAETGVYADITTVGRAGLFYD